MQQIDIIRKTNIFVLKLSKVTSTFFKKRVIIFILMNTNNFKVYFQFLYFSNIFTNNFKGI